jgi:hypothetical protein
MVPFSHVVLTRSLADIHGWGYLLCQMPANDWKYLLVVRMEPPGITSETRQEVIGAAGNSLGCCIISRPTVAVNADGRLQVFGVGADGGPDAKGIEISVESCVLLAQQWP